MTERLLQYIWQFQYFNRTSLYTVEGEPISIFSPGTYNTDQGPDFLNAKIKVGQMIWSGSVELHLHTSDWNKHEHEQDPHYNNVILHVVWKNDSTINELPVLELQHRISGILLERYDRLLHSGEFIPCGSKINLITELAWHSWKDRLVAERLLRKAAVAETFLRQNNYHWAETFWWLLARSFGSRLNADFFESLARTIPVALLARHKNHLLQLEALLLGQAGLLNGQWEEKYPLMLQREYSFLQHKYGLVQVHGQPLFLRMRPINFPTVRLAQLAMLIHQTSHLFSKVKDTTELRDIYQWLDITANDYWHYHYRLGEQSSFKPKKLGMQMIESIIINTIIPLLFVYGHFYKEETMKEKAVRWLTELPAESNTVLDGFEKIGISIVNSFDSQAMLELKSSYCNQFRCLDCAVGCAVLGREDG